MIDRYRNDEACDIWSDIKKYNIWSDIEIRYISNILDKEHDRVIVSSSDIINILEIESIKKHDVASFVEWLENKLSNDGNVYSRYVHFGLTSSDIVDTWLSISIKRTDNLIDYLCSNLIKSINTLCTDGTMPGRTHGKIAEHITIHDKFYSYINILSDIKGKILLHKYPGRLKGPVGDKKHIKEFFPNFDEIKVLDELGCCDGSYFINGQIISRAYHASIISDWALLSTYIEKIATDMRILSMDGIYEVSEGFSSGQVGSSSMPHKKNPIGFENICGISRMVRSYVNVAMENIVLWNERDISHSSSERIMFPDIANLLCYQLVKLNDLMKSLVMHHDTINFHINDSCNIMSSHRELLDKIHKGESRAKSHLEGRMKHGPQNNSYRRP